MSFKPKFNATGPKTPPIPSGSYDARCYGVVELGTRVRHNKFKGIDEKYNEMMLFFEIPELEITFDLDGKTVTKPRATYPRFKVSMHEKAKIRIFIEAWFLKKFPSDEDAANFDFSKLIGHTATLGMEQNGDYSNIVTIGPLHKAAKMPKQHNPSINFGCDDFNAPVWDELYPWVQTIIRESDEYKAHMALDADTPVETPDDDSEESQIPF